MINALSLIINKFIFGGIQCLKYYCMYINDTDDDDKPVTLLKYYLNKSIENYFFEKNHQFAIFAENHDENEEG